MVPVVDAHAHIFSSADRDPRDVSELVPAERTATLEAYRARLDSTGVDYAVLVPLDAADEYVASQLTADSGRFRAVAIASQDELGRTGLDPVERLQRRRQQFPFSAVRTMWLGDPGAPLSASSVNPLLAHLQDEELILWSYLPPDQAPFLAELGECYPRLRVVLNHLGFTPHDLRVDEHGRPWFATGLTPHRGDEVLRLAQFPSFHLMLSGHYALSHEPYPYPDLHDLTARLVDAFGPERTMWGSDWPWIDAEPGYGPTRRLVDLVLAHLSDDERGAVLGGTASRLFGFTG
jgi:predicted TIM-barrel fold metal-dependent hydrolase